MLLSRQSAVAQRDAPSENSCKQDGNDRLNTLRARETRDIVSGGSRRLDRGSQRDDEVLEFVLGHSLDHCLEREPGSLDDSVIGVCVGRDELTDPVDSVLREVLFGDLAEDLAVGRRTKVESARKRERQNGDRCTHKHESALTLRRGASPLAQPRRVIMSELRPSMSSMELSRMRMVWLTSVVTSSSSMSDSMETTRACRMDVSLRLSAEPATETRDPRARALKAESLPPMRAGSTTGKMELARTDMISRRARRAVSD